MNPATALTRIYSHNEHLTDMIVHVIGVLFAINASLWLLWHVTGLSVVISVSVYCAGLFVMIAASAAYNLMPHERPSKKMLRQLDHSAIFIMIAATYTPFAANRLGDPVGDIILAAIWICATIGIAMKLLFPGRFELVSVGFYLAMGWTVLGVIRPLAMSLAAVNFWLLMTGGLIYSAGVAFYLIERIPHHKTIWHAFVLIAAMLHFAAIAREFAA